MVLSWDEIHGLMERAVKRGLERREAESVTKLGVDEKAFRKGHSYLTLVNDLVKARVLYVAEGRRGQRGRVLGGTRATHLPPHGLDLPAYSPGADRASEMGQKIGRAISGSKCSLLPKRTAIRWTD